MEKLKAVIGNLRGRLMREKKVSVYELLDALVLITEELEEINKKLK